MNDLMSIRDIVKELSRVSREVVNLRKRINKLEDTSSNRHSTQIVDLDEKGSTDLDDIKARAKNGDVEDQYNLGLMYDLGFDVTENKVEALKWYTLAAKQGHTSAKYRVCILQHKLKQRNGSNWLQRLGVRN